MAALLFLSSCTTKQQRPFVIWTCNEEFASYVELFNATHDDAKAVVVYKEEPIRALPPARNEVPPDIIIGPWLKNSTTRKYFAPIDYLFSEQNINKSEFYSSLIDYGVINEKQYLLPVSFNLPSVVFNRANEEYISNSHMLTLNEIRDSSKAFNRTNQNGAYSAMGYGPSWDENFLYLITKLQGAAYMEKGTGFSWNDRNLNDSVSYIRSWTTDSNTDTTSEQNFEFKYLYMPKYRQISSERCLFAYMTSAEFFTLTDEQSSDLSFRWVTQDSKIPVEDDLVCMGLYKHSKNTQQAEVFMSWFSKEETQRALMERTESMKLNIKTFGIAGGFSSIRSVNENVYPTYYRQLLSNLPPQNYLELPNILPSRWTSLKARVIAKYLKESTDTNSEKEITQLNDRIAEWNRQHF